MVKDLEAKVEAAIAEAKKIELARAGGGVGSGDQPKNPDSGTHSDQKPDKDEDDEDEED